MKKTTLITITFLLLISIELQAKVKSITVDENRSSTSSRVPPKMSVNEKKQHFRDLFVPVVNKVYADLDKQYREIKALVDAGKESPKIDKLMKSYSASDKNDLLKRMKPHPKSVALAQAAMESSWGTSRFFTLANNAFGIWSFNKNEPRVPASQKRGDTTIYVKKYASIEASIRDYYKVLASGKAFYKFRELKMKTSNPYEIVKGLDNYSEKGAEYGEALASIIRFNKFDKFDK